MRKAKISVHSADVKSVLRTFSIEVAAKDKDDLEEEPIVVRLRKVRAVDSYVYKQLLRHCIRQEVPAMIASSRTMAFLETFITWA